MPDEPARRHLLRLLGRPRSESASLSALRTAVAGDCDRVARGLVDEALASDDVTSAEAAQAFLAERLEELGDALDADTRARIAESGAALIRRRAPLE